jgi:hypothetical protein
MLPASKSVAKAAGVPVTSMALMLVAFQETFEEALCGATCRPHAYFFAALSSGRTDAAAAQGSDLERGFVHRKQRAQLRKLLPLCSTTCKAFVRCAKKHGAQALRLRGYFADVFNRTGGSQSFRLQTLLRQVLRDALRIGQEGAALAGAVDADIGQCRARRSCSRASP